MCVCVCVCVVQTNIFMCINWIIKILLSQFIQTHPFNMFVSRQMLSATSPSPLYTDFVFYWHGQLSVTSYPCCFPHHGNAIHSFPPTEPLHTVCYNNHHCPCNCALLFVNLFWLADALISFTIFYPFYADDTQVYLSCDPNNKMKSVCS